MANFSDVTSNLVLQIRCSSEILEMAGVTPENSFEENIRLLRENFGSTNRDVRELLQKFIRSPNEDPIDAFYRFERLLRNPSLGFNRMDEVSQFSWISDSLKKILPTDPYRHFRVLWHQQGETTDLLAIRKLIKMTMEIFSTPSTCYAVEADSEIADVYAMDYHRRFNKKIYNNEPPEMSPEIIEVENRLSKLEERHDIFEKKQDNLEKTLTSGFQDLMKGMNDLRSDNRRYNNNGSNYFNNNQNRL